MITPLALFVLNPLCVMRSTVGSHNATPASVSVVTSVHLPSCS